MESEMDRPGGTVAGSRSQENWWHAERRRSEPGAEPVDLAMDWASTTRELRPSDSERLLATIWRRGEEKLITLQWLIKGADGAWIPVNTPPDPRVSTR